jgi:hypothetical protein
MKNKVLKWSTAGALASIALGTSVQGQSADALIDKLVEKGILTVKEANELREETDKGFTQAYQVKSGMPDWVTSFKINGDFRGRFEDFFADNPAFVDRTRFRYRLRFGAVATIKDDFEVGFRFTSSEATGGGSFGGDPISGNTTLTGNASKKFVYIDQAYAKWSALHTPDWNGSLTVGKMESPFGFSDMVFDPDYTPEGAAAQVGYSVNDRHSLKLVTGGFLLREIGGSSSDAWMFGSQARWDATWQKKLSSSLGLAILSIANPDNLGNNIAAGTSTVPNQNLGNTRNPAGNLFYDFNPIVADASVTFTVDSFPLYTGAFPIKVGGEYMNNAAASGDHRGYSLGATLGKAGKKKTYELSYTYKYLGADAWYEEIVDSDFGAFYQTAQPNSGAGAGYAAGTNTKGHIVKLSYSPSDALTLTAKWFRTELIRPVPADSDSMMNRVQVDASIKF